MFQYDWMLRTGNPNKSTTVQSQWLYELNYLFIGNKSPLRLKSPNRQASSLSFLNCAQSRNLHRFSTPITLIPTTTMPSQSRNSTSVMKTLTTFLRESLFRHLPISQVFSLTENLAWTPHYKLPHLATLCWPLLFLRMTCTGIPSMTELKDKRLQWSGMPGTVPIP